METNPYDGIFLLSQSADLAELQTNFKKLMIEFGFDLFAIQSSTSETRASNQQPHFLCNFEAEWVEQYYSARYFEIDPVITLGKEQKRPYFWDQLRRGLELTPLQKEFFSEADEFGVGSGVGIPMMQVDNEPAIISLVSSMCKPDEVKKVMNKYHLHIAPGISFPSYCQ